MSSSRLHSLFLVLPVLLSGCVEGHVGDLVKYDKNTDSFHLVQFYTNLHATQAKDLDHLAHLWKKKNAIIVSPVDAAIFSTYALEKLSKNEFRPVSLGEPDKTPPARTSKADLNAVKVIPGEFFLNRQGNLGYFHQAIVPGKVVDALLVDFAPDIFTHIAKEANRQIQLADKTEKVRKLNWEDARKEVLRLLVKNGEPPPKGEAEDQWPLEMASLKMLAQVGAQGSGKLTRRGDAFTLNLPMTAKDAKELLALADVVRTTLTKPGQPDSEVAAEMLQAIQVEGTEGGLALTVHAGKLFAAQRLEVEPKADPAKLKGYQATVVGAQSRGLLLSNDTALRKLVKDFGVKVKDGEKK